MLRKIHDPQRGASMIEYAAVILLVASILTVVMSAGIGDRVSSLISDAIKSVSNPAESNHQATEETSPKEESGSQDDPEDSGEQSQPEAQENDPQVDPAFNDQSNSSYKFSFSGYTDDFAEGFKDQTNESWNTAKDNWNQFWDSPSSYVEEKAKEDAKQASDLWNYITERQDELYQADKDRFSERWDDGNYLGALAGYAADAVYTPTWRTPVSPGGLWRGIRDSIYDQEAQEAYENGDTGRADGIALNNALQMFVNPFGKFKIPGIPKGGGGKGDKGGTTRADGEKEPGREDGKNEDGKRPSCKRNSFVAGTPVLLADGSTMPIEDVETGDKVLAFDPLTGKEGPREVTDTITGHGKKTLVDITITDSDGDTSTITATDEHPFWAPQSAEWVDAADLTPGTWLRASSGSWSQVSTIETRKVSKRWVYNLTVTDLSTFYAGPWEGNTAFLVHNDDPCKLTSDPDTPAFESLTVGKGKFQGGTYRMDVENSHPGVKGGANLHIQLKGRGYDEKKKDKYFYNPADGSWTSKDGRKLPKKVEKLIKKKDIEKGLGYLGLN